MTFNGGHDGNVKLKKKQIQFSILRLEFEGT